MPDQTMTFAGGAQTVAGNATYGDSVYLASNTAAMSLLGLVSAAMATAETGGTCILQQNGKIKLSATGTFNLTWTTTLLRDLLGFTQGNLPASGPDVNSYEADEISPLLWTSGMTSSPGGAVLDLSGSKHHDAIRTQAPDGTQVTRIFGTAVRRNHFKWTYIPKEYHQTTGDLGGELSRFWDEVLVKGNKFSLYRDITFDSTSSTTMDLTGTVLTPLEMEDSRRAFGFRRSAGLETVEQAYDFSMKTITVPEYS
jgi:hypothetical protein